MSVVQTAGNDMLEKMFTPIADFTNALAENEKPAFSYIEVCT